MEGFAIGSVEGAGPPRAGLLGKRYLLRTVLLYNQRHLTPGHSLDVLSHSFVYLFLFASLNISLGLGRFVTFKFLR